MLSTTKINLRKKPRSIAEPPNSGGTFSARICNNTYFLSSNLKLCRKKE